MFVLKSFNCMNDWSFGSFLEKHLEECNRVVSTKLRFAGQTTTESKNNLYQTQKELKELENILKEVDI